MTKTNYPHLGNEGAPGFDWDLYEDGWNGKSLKRNSRVKLKKSQEANNVVVYSHEKYVNKALKGYFRNAQVAEVPNKEFQKGDVLEIVDLKITGPGTALATVRSGASDIQIDLEKEQRFYNVISMNEGETLNKDTFIKCIKNPEIKKQILGMGLSVKVGADIEKASIWDGFVAALQKEMTEQITAANKAYNVRITDYNDAGLKGIISDAVKVFLPASLISPLRSSVEDLANYVGKEITVMVESYNSRFNTFVVSHNKFVECTYNSHMDALIQELNQNVDKVVTATITNANEYGVFVVVDEYVSGMLHKTLVSDELRQMMRDGTVPVGEQLDVYYHRIEPMDDGTLRVIFSDAPSADRDAVIARREAEDEAEKAALAEASENVQSETAQA